MSGTTHDGGRVTTRPIGRIQEEDLTFQMGRATGPRESGQWPLHANFPEYARECPNIPDVSLKPELRVPTIVGSQLRAIRGRTQSYRTVLVDNPLDSPAPPLQLSVSAGS